MPYAMQMDKATRLISGLTNSRNLNDFVLGSQIKKYYVIKDKNWAFGDKLEISSWLQKSYDDSLAFSARLLFTKEQKISGSSSMIRSPVQSANPLNFGGRLFEFGLGANKVFNFFERKHSRVGIEILFALKNNKNVIADFICPTKEIRKKFAADFTIWMDTIKKGRFEDTNQLFVPPQEFNFRVRTKNADFWSKKIYKNILTVTIIIMEIKIQKICMSLPIE